MTSTTRSPRMSMGMQWQVPGHAVVAILLGVLVSLGGCASPAPQPHDPQQVEWADTYARNRIVMCAVGYLSSHALNRAEISYTANADKTLQIRTRDRGLEQHLLQCVDLVPRVPIAGEVVIDSVAQGGSHVRL
ncbi:hypothetical protein NUH87_31015 [Pseudomonas batumici]|uniref:hypothetical protein n=1 Tax=Pseudomonas batumici TaxID=226910 RepID=UPI0030CDE9FA